MGGPACLGETTVGLTGTPPSLVYDASAELTLKGTVVAVETRGRMPTVTLSFLAGETPWTVRVAPREVLERLSLALGKGDVLEILGCPSKGPEGPCFLARSITRGETTVTLPDASGHPVARSR